MSWLDIKNSLGSKEEDEQGSIDWSLLAGAETIGPIIQDKDGNSKVLLKTRSIESLPSSHDDHSTTTSASSAMLDLILGVNQSNQKKNSSTSSSTSSSSSTSTSSSSFKLKFNKLNNLNRDRENDIKKIDRVNVSEHPTGLNLNNQLEDRDKNKLDPWLPKLKGLSQDPNDWLWLMTEEPHRSRRRAILKDHPEVRRLMGHTWTTKYVVLLVITIQLSIAIYFGLRSELEIESAWSWKFFLTAYIIGGTANQNLFLAIHEITHNLAFKNILNNKILALFTNLPIVIPYAMLFKKYHLEHHKALGEDGIDTDLPTRLELILLKNVLGKAFFATFQILFYALRPGFVRAQKITPWVISNFSIQIIFNVLIFKFFGMAALMYLLLSSFLAGSLHPCAAHFIAEHYIWNQLGGEQETWSYYGPLNILAYNVGYHNEHHDFPSIPWTRLPRLKEIAKEYYEPLPKHDSWPLVTIRFIFDKNIGLFSRVKRLPLGPHLPIIPPPQQKHHHHQPQQQDFQNRKNI